MNKQMKKVLVFTAMVLIAMGAEAQKGSLYLGANNIRLLPFGQGSTANVVGTGFSVLSRGNASVTMYGIAPEIGYFVSDKWVIGGVFGVGGAAVKDAKDTYFSYAIRPYVRYFLHQNERFGFYLQGGFDFELLKYGSAKTTTWSAGILPGVSCALSSHFSVTAAFGKLGYQSQKESGASNATNTFALSLDASTLQLGLYYKF
jgi:hypothetical protein